MAGQDIRKLVPAGGGFPIQVSGDYIYLKFADRAIDVIINGGRSGQTRVNMEAGDKYRPGPFEAFEVVNPDPDNAAQVIFTVGEGDYNRQIVQGDVSVTPVLRAADGTTREDTRREITASVFVTDPVIQQFSRGDQIWEKWESFVYGALVADDEGVYLITPGKTVMFDLFSGEKLGTFANTLNETFTEINAGSIHDGTLYLCGERGSNYGCSWQGKISRGRLSAGKFYTDWPQGKKPSDVIYNPVVGKLMVAQRYEFRFVSEFSYTAWENQTAPAFPDGEIPATDLRPAYWVDGAIMVNGYLYHPETGKRLPDARFNPTYQIYKQACYSARSGAHYSHYISQPVRAYSGSDDLKYNGKLQVTASCQNIAGLVKKKGGVVTAMVNYQESDYGYTISGQLIRAALESYYDKPMPDDYLDHVYALRVQRTENGNPFVEFTGAASFDRANIPDDFTIETPNRITVTIDNELE